MSSHACEACGYTTEDKCELDPVVVVYVRRYEFGDPDTNPALLVPTLAFQCCCAESGAKARRRIGCVIVKHDPTLAIRGKRSGRQADDIVVLGLNSLDKLEDLVDKQMKLEGR